MGPSCRKVCSYVHCTPKDQEGEGRAHRAREPGRSGLRGSRDQQRGAPPIPQEPPHRGREGGGCQQVDRGHRHLPPVPPQGPLPKNQVRLLRELEKKFSGQHVVLVAQRRIQKKESKKTRKASKGQVRPYSRSLTAVHEAILADLVFPANISGKRTRMSLDGSRTSRCRSTTPMRSPTSLRPSRLCTRPSRASTRPSSSPPRRSKLTD